MRPASPTSRSTADVGTSPRGNHWTARAACLDKAWTFDQATDALDRTPRGVANERIRRRQIADAVAVCRTCPVLAQCGEWVLSLPNSDDHFGIYAAWTPKQRTALRRRMTR